MSGGRKIRRGRSVDPQKLETEVQESLPQVFCSSAGHDTEVLDLEDRGKEICRQSTWFSSRFGTCWSWRKEVRRG